MDTPDHPTPLQSDPGVEPDPPPGRFIGACPFSSLRSDPGVEPDPPPDTPAGTPAADAGGPPEGPDCLAAPDGGQAGPRPSSEAADPSQVQTADGPAASSESPPAHEDRSASDLCDDGAGEGVAGSRAAHEDRPASDPGASAGAEAGGVHAGKKPTLWVFRIPQTPFPEFDDDDEGEASRLWKSIRLAREEYEKHIRPQWESPERQKERDEAAREFAELFAAELGPETEEDRAFLRRFNDPNSYVPLSSLPPPKRRGEESGASGS